MVMYRWSRYIGIYGKVLYILLRCIRIYGKVMYSWSYHNCKGVESQLLVAKYEA